MDPGTYTIEVYQLKPLNNDSDRMMINLLGNVSFTVMDNQILPTFSKTARAEKVAALTQMEIQSAFEVRFNGYDVSSGVVYDFTSDGSTAIY